MDRLDEYRQLDRNWTSVTHSEETGSCYVFDKDEHCQDLISNFNLMQKDEILTDVYLASEDAVGISFHSILLAGVSEVFRDIFCGPHFQYLQGTFYPKDMSPVALAALHTYLYRPLAVVEGDWKEIMDFSSSFGIHDIVNGQLISSKFLQNLQNLHANAHICFTLINILDESQEEFPVNAAVLAASSPMILDIVAPKFLPPFYSPVTFSNVKPCTISVLLDYIYSAELVIDHNNVQNLLMFATSYCYPAIVRACCNYIEFYTKPDNCLGVLSLARSSFEIRKDEQCNVLVEATKKFVVENFHSVITYTEFEHIPTAEDILDYLSKADKEKLSLKDTLHALIRWYFYDCEGRNLGFAKAVTALYFRLNSGDAKDVLDMLNFNTNKKEDKGEE